MTWSARKRSRAAEPAPPAVMSRVSSAYAASVLVVVAARSTGLFGAVGEAAFGLLTAAATLAVLVGVRLNRPPDPWAWWLQASAGALWTVGAVLRVLEQSTGDLSASRGVLADLVVIPGYLLFMVGLLRMIRARRNLIARDGAVLDAAMVAMSALLLGWVLLVDPLLSDLDAATVAKVAILVYPPLSLVLVSLAARLAFSAGTRCRAYSLMLWGMCGLWVGDLAYLLVEVHVGGFSEAVAQLPYGLTSALIGAAALHPSARRLGTADLQRGSGLPRGRLALVGVSLVVPAAMVPWWEPSSGVERAVVGATMIVLSASAVARVLAAMWEQRRSEARLSYEATHDMLTGLPNRSALMARLEDLLADPTGEVAVLFVDLDQFKLINDTLGHAAGDALLLQAGRRIGGALDPGQMLGRISGDEFVVLAPGAGVADGELLAERVRDAFGAPFDLGSEVFVTVSIGLTTSGRGGGSSAAELIRDADTAMYRSKDRGRNLTTTFTAAMGAQLARRVSVERDLRTAIHQGGLTVAFQPIVSLEHHRVEGVEALVRWPAAGRAISPAEFIPVAEDSGLIVPLGRWVLEQSCAQLADWRRLPGVADLTMSVNISVRQLREPDIVDVVAAALEHNGLPGSALWLEITESVMLDDTGDTTRTLAALRELGVGLSVDDFGTGYSSLSYLKRFPVSRIKIDRSFVSDLRADGSSRTLVNAIVAMSGALHMGTIAEGIETPEQARELRAMGCLYGQGYLFARPAPASELTAALALPPARPELPAPR